MNSELRWQINGSHLVLWDERDFVLIISGGIYYDAELAKTYDFHETEDRLVSNVVENGYLKPWNDPNEPILTLMLSLYDFFDPAYPM